MENNYKIIVAYDEKRGIGKGLEIPWYISEDLKRLKNLTLNQYVIMGSKTFQSIINRIGKPLPKRHTIILSKRLNDIPYENCTIVKSIEEAFQVTKEAWILGGHDIYKEFIPFSSEIFATEIQGDYNCDVFFPNINKEEWKIENIEQRDNYKYVHYIKSLNRG